MRFVSFLLSERKLRVLSTVLLEPQKTFSLTGLMRAAGPGNGATQRYIQQLVESEVLTVEPGRQRRYRANQAHPIFQELRAICSKVPPPDIGTQHV